MAAAPRSAAADAAADAAAVVRVLPRAIPAPLHATLRRAFAPGAPFWEETRYHTDARYFSFWYDLRAPPAHAVERLAVALRARLPPTSDTILPPRRHRRS